VLKCQPADWTSLLISFNIFFAVVPSTGKDPVKVDYGASPIVLKILLTASSSVVLVVIVIKVIDYQKNYQFFY